MTKKTTKTAETKYRSPFYSTKGIVALVLALIVISVFALWGMYALGVIRLPESVSSLFAAETEAPRPSGAVANIAPEETQSVLQEAIPREEYALALADMAIPDAYYRNYKITILSGNTTDVTEYFAIQNGEDWWVQTAKDAVILSTAVCKDGTVRITDNAKNASVTVPAYTEETQNGVSFTEKCGIMTLAELTEIIRRAAAGETVEYGGGISGYSLSYTPSLGTGENLFSFSFVTGSGVSEEYTFAFESATILSATKSYAGNVIYKMELTDYRNTLTDFDLESLIQ